MRKEAIFLLLILVVNCVSASYIIGDIYVYSDGVSRFDLESDVDLGIENIMFNDGSLTGRTMELTSFENGVWKFEIDKGNFDTIQIDLHLPRNLGAIKEVRGNERSIDLDSRVVSLIDSDTNLGFEISYTLKNVRDYSWFYFIGILVFILLAVFLFFNYWKKKKKIEHVFPLVNDNEKKIIEILMKGTMRQKELRNKLGVPKASFTRYIINLEKKKLIFREGEGKNKIVKLK